LRATIIEGVEENALLTAARVSREFATSKGNPTALIVDEAGVVQLRVLTLSQTVAQTGSCSDGIAKGERGHRRRASIRRAPRSEGERVPFEPSARHLHPRPTPRSRSTHAVALLHRPADLRVGDRDRHRACGRARHRALAGRAVSEHCATAVTIQAIYPGASAETAQTRSRQVIEQQLTGVDNLLYFSATSSSSGQVQITATFAPGTNPDIAQVQVQNKVQQAISRLPQEVIPAGRHGCRNRQRASSLIVALSDTMGRFDNFDLSDYPREPAAGSDFSIAYPLTASCRRSAGVRPSR